MRSKRENGVALITALLVLLLVSAMVVGMSWMVMTDQHLGGNNMSRETAFYGAEAGMERMTAEMGNTFATQGSLTAANIATIEGDPPVLPGISYVNSLGQSTYQVVCTGGGACPSPSASATILPPSPYAGMSGLITPFTLSVSALTSTGSEVKLERSVQVVAIPVFQFGIFSQTDLAFFAGPPFDFGGRVHTNGNLWLAANSGPLYMRDKVTVSGQVIRTNLENGVAVNSGSYGGAVTIADPAELPTTTAYPPSPSYTNTQWRALGLNEGSVTGNSVYGAVSTSLNNPTWSNTVVPAYQGMLQNGVQPLNLVATALGGLQSPINIIRRPVVGEQAANPAQFNQRQFSEASLRILLDDYGKDGTCQSSDMMALDTVTTGTNPIDLTTLTSKPTWWGTAATFYPLPTSGGGTTYSNVNGYWLSSGKPIITGCIKIEYQNNAGTAWTDVTEEILKEGFIGRNIYPQAACTTKHCTNTVAPSLVALPVSGTAVGAQGPPGNGLCGPDPNPNAIIRLARLRDNPSNATSGGCGSATANGYDYWPLALYDTREGINRDVALGNDASNANSNPYITSKGVVDYIELDVNNLARWFMGNIGSSGTNADNVGGYSIYFSDRRGNQIDPTAGINIKTGSFGFNDIVNPSDATNGCPNNVMDGGEDLEGDAVFRTYGGRPLSAGPAVTDDPPLPGFLTGTPNLVKNPNCAAATQPAGAPPGPNYVYTYTQEARENPPVFFRRALKLVDGTSFSLGTACYGASPNPPCGLTIASENPVYIQGDYNAPNNGSWNPVGVAASVMADAVTMLSDSWNDVNSFISPYSPGSRTGTTTAYRVAIIAGKGIPFAQGNISNSGPDFGTDGGLHNFLRFLESWNGTLYYKGSLVSFYANRQAIGEYKCCNTVYGAPSRGYSFDADFSQGPQWLPPRTPTLRSINTVGFTQELLPTQ